MKNILFTVFANLVLLSSHCVSSTESSVRLNPAPEDDPDYIPVYESNSDKVELINNFETRYIITATNLSAEFLKSFAIRYEKLFNEPQPILAEAATKAGFFVSIFASNRDMRDLADDQIWNVQLEVGDKILKPVVIKHLPQKERWRPFFKNVSLWTREYLILFDAPQSAASNKGLVKSTNLSLIIASADAKVTIKW